MHITGTHINYYFVCKRKLWLFANSIQMEHTSNTVFEGRLIHEHSYSQRNSNYEELELAGIKVDFYDPFRKVIHEIKKTPKLSHAHRWQLKYYIYVMEQNGLEGVTGILEYPKQKKTETVELTPEDREAIPKIEETIRNIIAGEAPEEERMPICARCSYFDFCFIHED